MIDGGNKRMKLLTENRGDYVDALKSIDLQFLIAPFGFDIKGFEEFSLQIITKPKYEPTHYRRWQIKTNNKIHAKLAIGSKGVIIGSWNFTNNSTENAHECSVVIDDVKIIKETEAYFKKIWDRI